MISARNTPSYEQPSQSDHQQQSHGPKGWQGVGILLHGPKLGGALKKIVDAHLKIRILKNRGRETKYLSL